MKEVVISVGMGPGQIEFIRRLKQLNYCVAAFGKGKNSEEAKRLADYSCEIDTRDADGVIEWIKELGVKVIAVGSYAGGMAVLTVQKLSNYYHVPTNIPHQLIVGLDKENQQRLYEKYALSTIKSWNAEEISLEEIKSREENLFIIKPKVGRGSAGIQICDRQLVAEYLENPLNCNDNNMIQVLCQGTEYRCVIFVQGGEIKLLAPISRTSYRDTTFLGVLKYAGEHKELLENFMQNFVREANIINTIMKADIIVSPQMDINVIEMDIGVGGGTYYKEFVSELYNRNLMDEYIKLITNQEMNTFNVSRPNLRMDYIFNRTGHAVSYDLNKCKSVLEKKLGRNKIIINRLHPEVKKNYESNADFLFTVIYEDFNKSDKVDFWLDDYINQNLLQKRTE